MDIAQNISFKDSAQTGLDDADNVTHDLSPELSPVQLEQLDPRGDLILAMGPLQLLVSSRVLVLSSHFFETMLRPNSFMEGMDPPSFKIPRSRLSTNKILRPFAAFASFSIGSVERLTSLADTCNFYGCYAPLSSHARVWLYSWDFSVLRTMGIEKLLWVAFIFNNGDAFEQFSRRLAIVATAEELDLWDVHPIPAFLKG